MLSEMPGDDTLQPEVWRRFIKLGQVFHLMSDMIEVQLRDPSPVESQVDLAQIVEESLGVLTGRTAVPVVTEVVDAAVVPGDPVQLRRAFGNVLDNAVRAAGTRGSVQVRVGQEEPGVACIQVVDDGAGFGLTPQGEGQGLSVVGSVIRQCRGRIEVSSGPGPGTTVRLLFPTQAAELGVS